MLLATMADRSLVRSEPSSKSFLCMVMDTKIPLSKVTIQKRSTGKIMYTAPAPVAQVTVLESTLKVKAVPTQSTSNGSFSLLNHQVQRQLIK